jgi:hypothetical protein
MIDFKKRLRAEGRAASHALLSAAISSKQPCAAFRTRQRRDYINRQIAKTVPLDLEADIRKLSSRLSAQ